MAFLGITEAVLGLCDLLEAEGRLLRVNVFRTTGRCLLLLCGVFFGVAALVCFLASAYEAMLLLVSRPVALGLLGAASAIISAVFLWMSKSRKKKQG